MPDDRPATTHGAIVIPVKAFDRAKERLAGALSPDQRVALAMRTAARVVATATALPQFATVVVVCDDEGTATWARNEGAHAIIAPQPGLNAAVTHAVAAVRGAHGWVAVCHADVADPTGLAGITAPPRGTVTLVPDRHGTGTNVLAINSGDAFTFRYGPTSLADHRAEAERRGLAVRIVTDTGLALDLDTPEDVALLDGA